MKARNTLVALIGLWFIAAPWVLGFTSDSTVVLTSVIVGVLQFAASMLAYGKSGWGTWQNWISLLAGVWFIVLPSLFTLSSDVTLSSIILGAITVLLNLWNLASSE
ncbi:SPW repeat protein [Paenibacillus sp. KN14-4R]|uniref:SPW repeat protein n=1 Tax=Paenibacillus sp. KN14-4R TaxID=3445773 RepID=UPI003FA0990D